MALKRARIITLTGVKGGTGKTTLALSLAGLISEEKKKVLILDIDVYGCAVAMSTNANADKNIFTLVDDLKNNRYVTDKDYVTMYNDYLSVLPAPKDPRQANKVTGKYLEIVLSKIVSRYDYIIIDTDDSFDDLNLVALDNSYLTFLVMTNNPVDVKNMHTIVSLFNDIEKENYKIILNESLNKENKLQKYDTKHMIRANIDYVIPKSFYIKNIDSYTLDGKIISLDKKIKLKYKKGIKELEKIKEYIMKED